MALSEGVRLHRDASPATTLLQVRQYLHLREWLFRQQSQVSLFGLTIRHTPT
jgi:hypothetical protein